MLVSRLLEETRVSRCFLLSYKFKNRCALNANEQTWTAIFTLVETEQWWRSTVELRQHNTEMLASTNRFFKFCYSCISVLHHGLDKKRLCNYERGAFISYHSLICRDKAERWIQTTLLPHKADCVPILDLSKQCDSLALLYHDVKCTGEEGGHLDDLLSS